MLLRAIADSRVILSSWSLEDLYNEYLVPAQNNLTIRWIVAKTEDTRLI